MKILRIVALFIIVGCCSTASAAPFSADFGNSAPFTFNEFSMYMVLGEESFTGISNFTDSSNITNPYWTIGELTPTYASANGNQVPELGFTIGFSDDARPFTFDFFGITNTAGSRNITNVAVVTWTIGSGWSYENIESAVAMQQRYDFDVTTYANNNPATAPVPEPATILLFGIGATALGIYRRKKT